MSLGPSPSGSIVEVFVRPRAREGRLEVRPEGALTAWVKAPPHEGLANEELVRMLARALGLPRSSLSLSAGTRGKRKLVRVKGMSKQEVLDRLRGHSPLETP